MPQKITWAAIVASTIGGLLAGAIIAALEAAFLLAFALAISGLLVFLGCVSSRWLSSEGAPKVARTVLAAALLIGVGVLLFFIGRPYVMGLYPTRVSVRLVDAETFPLTDGVYSVPRYVTVELHATGLDDGQSAWVVVQNVAEVQYYLQDVGPLYGSGQTEGRVCIGDNATPSGHQFRILGVIADEHGAAALEQNRMRRYPPMGQLPAGVVPSGAIKVARQ